MSRPNPRRDVKAEQHAAKNIEILRVTRGWSYEGLARRMAAVDCPIDQSAIYKIERGSPRRRITVDELVAFSRVFDRTLDELVADPDATAVDGLNEVLTEWFDRAARHVLVLEQQAHERGRLGEQIRAVLGACPDARSLLDVYGETGDFTGQPESWLAAELKNRRSASNGKRRTKA